MIRSFTLANIKETVLLGASDELIRSLLDDLIQEDIISWDEWTKYGEKYFKYIVNRKRPEKSNASKHSQAKICDYFSSHSRDDVSNWKLNYGKLVWYRVSGGDYAWWPSQIYDPQYLRGEIREAANNNYLKKYTIRFLNTIPSRRYAFASLRSLKNFNENFDEFSNQKITMKVELPYFNNAVIRAVHIRDLGRQNPDRSIYEHDIVNDNVVDYLRGSVSTLRRYYKNKYQSHQTDKSLVLDDDSTLFFDDDSVNDQKNHENDNSTSEAVNTHVEKIETESYDENTKSNYNDDVLELRSEDNSVYIDYDDLPDFNRELQGFEPSDVTSNPSSIEPYHESLNDIDDNSSDVIRDSHVDDMHVVTPYQKKSNDDCDNQDQVSNRQMKLDKRKHEGIDSMTSQEVTFYSYHI
jgi:hypothetical protein